MHCMDGFFKRAARGAIAARCLFLDCAALDRRGRACYRISFRARASRIEPLPV